MFDVDGQMCLHIAARLGDHSDETFHRFELALDSFESGCEIFVLVFQPE